jgi:hypothetical protein
MTAALLSSFSLHLLALQKRKEKGDGNIVAVAFFATLRYNVAK